MEVVNTLDIDGTQWEIQDEKARNKIVGIEELLTTKTLPKPTITRMPGVNWSSFDTLYHYSFGKIHFIYLKLQNVSNDNIGTTRSISICRLNILPIETTTFMLFDYINGRVMRCSIDENGHIIIGESNGVSSSNNMCIGELIFAEA